MYHGKIPQTALDAVKESGKSEIVELLLPKGAKMGSEIVDRNIEKRE